MALNKKAAFSISSLLLVISWLFLSSEAKSYSYGKSDDVAIANGLSWSFYDYSCPKVESIIRKHLKKVFKEDIGQAAGLLRLHFHDCFVLGCDASVLLDGPADEQEDLPNLTLRKRAFEIINELRELVHSHCGRVVSCADILTIAARDSVHMSGGPEYAVPLGRRDSLTYADPNVTLANIPPPTDNTSALLSKLATKNFDATDVVALSGGHTIGLAHCTSFKSRLYPTQDTTLDPSFAADLKAICPNIDDNTTTTVNDVRTPDIFDNKYYVDLVNRQGLFTSDQDLYSDPRTRGIVESFAADQELFFEQFVKSMLKMGQLGVVTGQNGEIRADCSMRNSDNLKLVSTVEEEIDRSEL